MRDFLSKDKSQGKDLSKNQKEYTSLTMSIDMNDDLDNILGTSEPVTTPAEEIVTGTPATSEIVTETAEKVVEVVSEGDDEENTENPEEEKDEDGTTSVKFVLRVKYPTEYDDKFRKALRADATARNKELLATLPEGSELTKEQKTASKDVLLGLVADAFIIGEKAVLKYIDAAQAREFAVRSSVITETKNKLQAAIAAMEKMRQQFKKMGLSDEQIDALMEA